MIKKATENDENYIKKLLGIENGEKNIQVSLNFAIKDDVFLLRIKSAFISYNLNHPDCEFYFVSPNSNKLIDSEVGILCIQGKSCIYAGPLQNSEEIESFLNFLQVESFSSNNMVLLGYDYTPQYLMCLYKNTAENIFFNGIDDEPDLWKLSESAVLSNVDTQAWYSDTALRTKKGVAHIMAVSIKNGNNKEYVATAGIYAMDEDNMYISAVETKIEHRKKGYASALIHTLANTHASKNAYVLCLPNMGDYYEKLGFKFARPVCLCTRKV